MVVIWHNRVLRRISDVLPGWHPVALAMLFYGVGGMLLAVAHVRYRVVAADDLLVMVLGLVALAICPLVLWWFEARQLTDLSSRLEQVVGARSASELMEGVRFRLRRPNLPLAVFLFFLTLFGVIQGMGYFLLELGLFGWQDPILVAWVVLWLWAGTALGTLTFQVFAASMSVVRNILQLGPRCQIGHPDGLGGLGWLRRFSVQNALLFSGGWLVVPFLAAMIMQIANRAGVILGSLTLLVGVAIIGVCIITSYVFPATKLRRYVLDNWTAEAEAAYTRYARADALAGQRLDEGVHDEDLFRERTYWRDRLGMIQAHRPKRLDLSQTLKLGVASLGPPLVFLVGQLRG